LKRFFKSAAFPILLVVVLAFVAQRLISPDTGEKPPTYNEFLQMVEKGDIAEVTINTKDNTLEVTEQPVKPADGGADAQSGEQTGEKFETGFPPNTEQSLLNQLDTNEVAVTVKGSGGGGILSILIYVLPFLLFFGFWIFLMNQMQGGGSRVMSFG
jgi:cell division protease FtsH